MVTHEQLEDIVARLEPRDFFEFADMVYAIDPIAGVMARLHAEAADGNSPDLEDWIEGTLDDATKCPATSEEAAREWWMKRYTDQWEEETTDVQ